ncbi:MAG: type II toxin-antitoxin system PemK/MazF family toxin [Chloroflexi bacterium]|nr:type II toxin-antitoxin system PemK/MazF family toxin [Chloroflexota bacterium]
MVFQRGEVVLLSFPYTDLSATKARPAVIISSDEYHVANRDILVAYVTSQIQQADPWLDYRLQNWATAGLLRPSLVKPRLAAIDPALVRHTIGSLTSRDLAEVDRRLRRAMALTETALYDIAEMDLTQQPAIAVQALAEKAIVAVLSFAAAGDAAVAPDQLRALMA